MSENTTSVSEKGNEEYERQRLITINRLALIVVSVIALFLGFGYPKDAFDGNITWPYAILVAVLSLCVAVVNIVFFMVKKDSKLLRHTIVITYGTLYAVIMMGAKSDLVFIVAVPLVGINMLYYDLSFMRNMVIGVLLINVVYMLYRIHLGYLPSGVYV